MAWRPMGSPRLMGGASMGIQDPISPSEARFGPDLAGFVPDLVQIWSDLAGFGWIWLDLVT